MSENKRELTDEAREAVERLREVPPSSINRQFILVMILMKALGIKKQRASLE